MRLLIGAVIPAWLLAGIADWRFHRATKIERTSGSAESWSHVTMGLEGGAGALAVLLLPPGAAAAIAVAAALLHEATAIYDVGYAVAHRPIPQLEDHTHSFLEVLPFVVAALAVARAADPPADDPPFRTRLAIALASGALGLTPHLEELLRCLRTEREA